MVWYAYAMILLIAVSSSLTILKIGQSRTPVTPQEALIVAAFNALFIFGIISLATS